MKSLHVGAGEVQLLISQWLALWCWSLFAFIYGWSPQWDPPKSDVANKKTYVAPHFWGDDHRCNFWLDWSKEGQFLNPSHGEICWANKLMKTRKTPDLLLLKDEIQKLEIMQKIKDVCMLWGWNLFFFRCWSATWTLNSRLGTFGSTRMLSKHPYDDEGCKQGNAKHNSKNWVM